MITSKTKDIPEEDLSPEIARQSSSPSPAREGPVP